MSTDARQRKYVRARFLSCPLAPGFVGERVRVRGPLVELILHRESHQTRAPFKNNPQRERGRFHAGHPDALAHAAGYFPGFETASKVPQHHSKPPSP